MKKEEKEVLNTKRETKNKIMTVLLCISLFCVFSILLLAIFNGDFLFGKSNNNENNKINENSTLTIYEYRYKNLDEDDYNTWDYSNEEEKVYSSKQEKEYELLNTYTYSCDNSNCTLFDGRDKYAIIGDGSNVYVYNLISKEKFKTSITYQKGTGDYDNDYIVNNDEFHYIDALDDISHDRIWLSSESKYLVYNYKEDKVFKEFKYDGFPTGYTPIKINSSLIYLFYDDAEDLTYLDKIYDKDFKVIFDLENCFYDIDYFDGSNLYIHTLKDYKNEVNKVAFYKINVNGGEKIRDFGTNRNVITLNPNDYSYVIVENNKIVLKDKNDKEIKVIGNVPKPMGGLGYEYVSKEARFITDDNGDKLLIVRLGCENGLQTGYYTKIFTYNMTKDKIEEKDLIKITD